MVDEIEFHHLLSGLGDKYKRLEQEAIGLRKEQARLTEEVARLRERLAKHEAPLPGAVPASDREEGPGSESGVLTLQSFAAMDLRSGDLDRMSGGVFFVSARVQKGRPQLSPLEHGPDATWGEFMARLPVDAHDKVLELDVFESYGADEPSRSLGRVEIQFRSAVPGSLQRRKEVISPSRSMLQFEMCWQPGGLQAGGEHAPAGPQPERGLLPKLATTREEPIADSWVDEHVQARQAIRFRRIFDLDDDEPLSFRVTVDGLAPLLDRRGMRNLNKKWLASALLEMAAIVPDREDWQQHRALGSLGLPALMSVAPTEVLRPLRRSLTPVGLHCPAHQTPDSGASSMSLGAFVEAIHMADLPQRVNPKHARGVKKMQAVLLKEGIEEVIDKVTRSRNARYVLQGFQSKGSLPDTPHGCGVVQERTARRVDVGLSIVVSITVLTSVVCLGLSQDYMTDSGLWLVLEILSAAIFVAEIAIKISIHGSDSFWYGDDKFWNWFDFTVAIISVGDVFVFIFAKHTSAGFSFGKLAQAGNLVLALRVFRLLRLARVLKVFRTPFLRELSNMLVGFLLGSPALFWVMIIIWFVVGLIALGFRIILGPEPGQKLLTQTCGSGDEQAGLPYDKDCEAYKLYAEEYCGTWMKCSFTVFRCMTGDCSTKGGQSLAEHLSAGFGARFDITYCIGMIILIFGLFNVITAIFVEATLAGLKYNETKQRLRSMYESKHVKKKLRELITRITDLRVSMGKPGSTYSQSTSSTLTESWALCSGSFEDVDESNHISLTEEEFIEVMKDDTLLGILEQLDIDVSGNQALFEVMDPNNVGKVDLASMIDSLMKLRGGLMKMDMIAPWVAIRSLRQEIRDLALSVGKVTQQE